MAVLYVCPAMIVLAGFLTGFGAALQSGSLEAWITDKLGEIGMIRELDRIFGRVTSFIFATDVLAGVGGSFVMFVGGYWWTISTAGIIAMATSCLALFLVSENWACIMERNTQNCMGWAGA